jgi:IPT/TIG domain-containing protein
MLKTTRTSGILAALLLPFLLCTFAFAGDLEMFPTLGATDDHVVIRGEEFPDEPVVSFDGITADVIRSNPTRILCLVPEGLTPGEVDVTVDGTLLDAAFLALPDGAPMVLRLSAETATPGMRVMIVGRRLTDGVADFVDTLGETAATVDLVGGRHGASVLVPEDLTPGDYLLVITNGDGLDTGDGSPEIEIVAPGTPELIGVDQDMLVPGRRITLTGTDLGPAGQCEVSWTDTLGETLTVPGYANGYDRVHSIVPVPATVEETYALMVTFSDGVETTGLVEVTVDAPGDPVIDDIRPEEGPAGSLVRIRGDYLLAGGAQPEVFLASGGESFAAEVLGARPDHGYRKDEILVEIPEGLELGDYQVTVVVGEKTSNAVDYSVVDESLSVTGFGPRWQGRGAAERPVMITGTGFGHYGGEGGCSVVCEGL